MLVFIMWCFVIALLAEPPPGQHGLPLAAQESSQACCDHPPAAAPTYCFAHSAVLSRSVGTLAPSVHRPAPAVAAAAEGGRTTMDKKYSDFMDSMKELGAL